MRRAFAAARRLPAFRVARSRRRVIGRHGEAAFVLLALGDARRHRRDRKRRLRRCGLGFRRLAPRYPPGNPAPDADHEQGGRTNDRCAHVHDPCSLTGTAKGSKPYGMTDLHLIVFGYGYSGSAIAQAARDAGFTTSATMRAPMRTGAVHSGVALVPFSEAEAALRETSHIVSTVPPDDDGDPVLNAFGRAIAGAPRLRWAGYISTTGVYGDRGGAWVDEDTPVAPGPPRARRRVEAEQAWTALGDRVAVDLFRTAGIYGPGRSVLDDVRAGKARRVVKPGQAFGRIHRDDIAAAVVTAAQQTRPPGVRVLHLADDEPAESAAVIAEAARLLDVPPPPWSRSKWPRRP